MVGNREAVSGDQFLQPRGLSEVEAAERLKREGANELPQLGRRSTFLIVTEVMREPMFALLLGGGVIYLLLGDLTEALILLAFATISVTITIVQETRSEHVLEALRDLTSPRALVVRDGVQKRIPGREVVRGDLIILVEGDRVPADALLLAAQDVETDESLLTGESVPVRKTAKAIVGDSPRPGGDDLPIVFSGTMMVRGHGEAEVRATGLASEIGRIGQFLSAIETEPPILRRQTEKLVRVLAIAGLSLSAVAVAIYGSFRGSWLDGLLGGIALSMSMLPEEFPLVLTVFMVMGAWRISQARVLTRRAAAIETLGAATVLCTDKTGTLTRNQMMVAELHIDGRDVKLSGRADEKLPQTFVSLAKYAILASAPEPFDPMERAINALTSCLPDARTHRPCELRLVQTYGLRPELLAVTKVWEKPGQGSAAIVATKGAPEAIATLCHLAGGALAAMRRDVDLMAAYGMRVLGVARADCRRTPRPDTPLGFNFTFLGLIGLADPLRPAVPQAVQECRSAGIRVVMVTGDHPATARAIAAEAGLEAREAVSGPEIEAMNDATLATKLETSSVFARIMPEQKLRIVNALKAKGAVVAMTGDGVNDAPSLKAAHIGIAMGGRGTDVAREASAIVLLDDDFGSIVRTIRLGRRIYDNLRKAMGYILAVHVPIAGLALFPLVFGWPLIFAPIHIAFLEMVIDPVCSIVFEAETEESDVMARPPRDPKSPLFSTALAGWSLVQGGLVLLLVVTIYVVALSGGLSEPELRALTFVSLVFTNIGLIFINRSFSASPWTALRRPNAALWLAVGTTLALIALAVSWPPAERLFHFGPLDPGDLAICAGAGVVSFLVLDLLKPIWRRRLIA